MGSTKRRESQFPRESAFGDLSYKTDATVCYRIVCPDLKHDDGISSTLKDIQLLEAQLSKDQKKVEAASAKKAGSAHAKVIETQRSLDQTMQLWETEAPFAFEAYQKIDLQRLETMKEAVTRFETIQSDAAQRLLDVSAQTLQSVLTFDPQADMQEFILKNDKGTGLGRSPTTRRPPTRDTPQRSDSVASSVRPTIAGRGTNGGATAAEFGAGPSSASIHSTDQQRTATRKSGGASSTLKSAFGRLGRGRSNKGEGDVTTIYGNLPDDAAGAGNRVRDSTDTARGEQGPSLLDDRTVRPTNARQESDEPLANQLGRAGAATGGGLMQPMVPTRATTGTASSSSAAPQLPPPQVDSEGFSIPPADRADRKPWESSTTGGANAGNQLLEEEREDLADLPPAAKMTNMNISDSPVGVSNTSQDQAALERVRSTLLTATPARRGTTRRDRRDVRNTTYNPMAGLDGTSIGQFGALAPQGTGGSAFSNTTGTGAGSPSRVISPTFSGTPGVGADRTQSIVSMSSAQGPAAANPFEAPAGSPGLRASIVETVNAILTSSGVARLMVVGEVSITAKDVSTTSPLQIRLGKFEQLEKAAPNPAFLSPISSKPGEYALDLASLTRNSGAGRATILKYQVHVPQHKIAQYVPLNVDARWRFESHQTSFLLTYTPNAECLLVQGPAVVPAKLEEVSFVTSVGPTKVSSVMSKPDGQWNEQQKRIHWKLEDGVSLSSSPSGPGKLLARFQVEGEGSTQPVQVRWRIPGQTMSSLDVGLAESSAAGGPVFEEVARQTVSGKYFAQ